MLKRVDSIDTSRKVLAHAAAQLGVAALAERLQISTRTLQEYLTGGALVPDEVFLGAVDVIVERLPDLTPSSAGPGASRSRSRDP
jgi:hypothetical protein